MELVTRNARRSHTSKVPITPIIALAAAVALLSGCDLFTNTPSSTNPGSGTTVVPVVERYAVTYDGNGSTAGPVPVDVDDYLANESVTVALAPDTLTKNGFAFGGWSLVANDASTKYVPNETFTISADTTLYAYWIESTATVFHITYTQGTASDGVVPVDTTAYGSGETGYAAWNEGVLTRENYVFLGWTSTEGATDVEYAPGDTIILTDNVTLYPVWEGSRSFWAYNWVEDTEYSFTATPLAVTRHCIVYADDNQGIDTATALQIATEYESVIYQKMRDDFGKPLDIDGNDALIILLFDIVDGATEDSGYIAGYFNSGDMYSTTSYSFSNEADLINMDVNPGIAGDSDFNSTIAHELQHLINFSVNYAERGINQEIWLNEGLSTAAEYVYLGSNDNSRVQDYNNYGDYTIAKGNNFFVWDGFWEDSDNAGDAVSNYTTDYMFFQWLRVHASNDTGIYKEILESGKRDYQAVTTYAAARIDSQFSDWATLMRTWYVATLCDDATGFFGYKGALGTLTQWYYENPNKYPDWALSPGEGIITMNNIGTFSPTEDQAHISYAGITEGSGTTATLDLTTPYGGTFSLVLNGNSSITGPDEQAFFPVASVSSSARSVSTLPSRGTVGAAPARGRTAIDGLIGADGTVVSGLK